MPTHASFLYARNVLNLLALYASKGAVEPGLDRRDRRRRDRAPRRRVHQRGRRRSCSASRTSPIAPAADGGRPTMNEILEYLTVFVLSAFVGVEVDLEGAEHPAHAAHERLERDPRRDPRRVDARPRLRDDDARDRARAPSRCFLATLNVVGGFVVTDRMLEMFKGKPDDRRAHRQGRRSESRDLPRPLLPGRGDHVHPRAEGAVEPAARAPGQPHRRRPAWPSRSPPPSPSRTCATSGG